MKFLMRILLKIRWTYFHINPTYVKFYMDSEKKECHFYNKKTNTIHSQYSVLD